MPISVLPNFIMAMPEIILAVVLMVLLIYGAFRGDAATAMITKIMVVTFAVLAYLYVGMEPVRMEGFNGLFVTGPFIAFSKVFMLLTAAAVLVVSRPYLAHGSIERFEYPVLIGLSVLGMILMVSSNNFMSFYVGLEMQSLSLYVLAAIQRDNARSSEAGLKYFILGAIASGLLLFGISLVYGFTGSISFPVVTVTLMETGPHSAVGAVIGMCFILAAMAFKISAAPFHMWTPDVYEGAPTSVTAFFSVVPKIAGLVIFIRILVEPFGPFIDEWRQIVTFLAVLSMAVGAFAGLIQTNIKRLLAYSSISHVGYALIGVVASGQGGISSVLVYLMIYAVMNVAVFTMILSLRKGDTATEMIEDLSGLAQTDKRGAYIMAALMFSMAGIPPLAGFFGKFAIFNAAVAENLLWLAVYGVVMSVVSAYYYLRIIKVMFFDIAGDAVRVDLHRGQKIVLYVSVLSLLFFAIFAGSIFDMADYFAGILPYRQG